MKQTGIKVFLILGLSGMTGVAIHAQATPGQNARAASRITMLDLQDYGARQMGYGYMGQTIVNTTVNSPNIKMTSDPSQFGLVRYLNGDGVAIPGAGAANKQSTPAAPSVTAFSVRQSAAYQYQCVGIDLNGGLTAAGAPASVSDGSANLGSGTALSVAAISRDDKGVLTVQTTVPHGFVMDPGPDGGKRSSVNCGR